MTDKNEIRNNRIDHIYRLLDATTKSMEKIKVMLKNLDKDDQRKSYQDVEGVMGVFDGLNLVTTDGQKFEVPANYSAKSRLLIGDTLKMIEEDGKNIFKQIEKVERKKVEGILTKKEGKWHIISDSGTYKVSDIAADFQHAELNDEASAFVPAKNLNVTFAALDTVKKKTPKTDISGSSEKPTVPASTHTTPAVAKSVSAPKQVRPAPVSRPAPAASSSSGNQTPRSQTRASTPKTSSSRSENTRPPFNNKPRTGAKPYKSAPKKEYVEDIVKPQDPKVSQNVNLDEDDLR